MYAGRSIAELAFWARSSKMGANWLCWISLRPVDVILPSAHQLLNWSAFWRILGAFGLDPRVVGRSVAELPGRNGLAKIYSTLNKL